MFRTFNVTLELDTEVPLDPDFDRGVVILDMGAERLHDRLNGLFDGTFRGAHVSAVREIGEAPDTDAIMAALRTALEYMNGEFEWHGSNACESLREAHASVTAALAVAHGANPPPAPETAESELARIRSFAKAQGDKMEGTEAKQWSDSRPPDGDDWNELYAQVVG